MPRRGAQKIVERPGILPLETSLQLWAEHRETARIARFDAWTRELSKLGAELPLGSSDLAESLAPVLDGLGRMMQADRIVFYSAPRNDEELGPESSRGEGESFEAAALWTSTDEGSLGVEAEPALTFDRAGDCGRTLRVGSAHRAAGRGSQAGPEIADRPGDRWASVRTILYVPCLASGKMLGVFGIEATLAASRWTSEVVARAEFAGRLVANLLDRSRLARELDARRARETQDDRLASLGGLACRVAHDFNNILTAILGYADLLDFELAESAADPLDANAKGREEIEEIRRAAVRGAELVEQVQSFGRVRKSRVATIDLPKFLADFEGTLQSVLGSSVTLAVDEAPGPETVSADDFESGAARSPAAIRPGSRVALDPCQLERILLNLAVNARDALRSGVDGPRFELSTCCVQIDRDGVDPASSGDPRRPVPGLAAGKYIRLTARDNGCGIEAETLERVFEPFFTTKDGSGTGLGLAITTEFVRAAGGGIRVESEPGQGSAFHLYFPLVEEVIAEAPALSESVFSSRDDRSPSETRDADSSKDHDQDRVRMAPAAQA